MSLPDIDPTGLFAVAGKVALVVGATGSFGQVVCATLGKAGARLIVTAGNATTLGELGDELGAAGIESVQVARRPDSEADCDAMVRAALEAYGCIDIPRCRIRNERCIPYSGYGGRALSEGDAGQR